MDTIAEFGPRLGVAALCAALAVATSTFYRRGKPKRHLCRRVSPRALPPEARAEVLDVLHEDRFVDLAPAQVYAKLLDEKKYLCSERTMYRILDENQEVRERRDQLRHPPYAKPELLATKPNQVWSWDITKLPGPAKWTHYHLYVIIDVFSRYVVGWMVAEHESAALAKKLIEETCLRQGIKPGQLTLHADRGSSMKSKAVALLLSDLGVTKTHSRPHVSDDNPFSESQFKTLKYRPEFPERFGCIEDARGCAATLLTWYNHEHQHSGLGLMTPYEVHYGLAETKRAARADVLAAAYAAHPERFVRGVPVPPPLPTAVWINPPPREAQLPAAAALQPEAGTGSPAGPERSGGGAQRLDAVPGEGYPRPPAVSEEAVQ